MNIRKLRHDEKKDESLDFEPEMKIARQKPGSFLFYCCLIFCLFFTSCQQPPTGELEPMTVEGATLATSRFENDTLLFAENGLSVKFYGSWEGAIGLRVAVQNRSGKDVVVKFDELTAENGKRESAKIGGIMENQNGEYNYLRHARTGSEDNNEKAPQVSIKSGEQRNFTVGLAKVFSYSKDDKANTIYIILPIEVDKTTKTVKEFKTVFRKIERKTKDMPDPQAW